MPTDWIHYKCMTGQTLFMYNKVTGEHRFPKGDKMASAKTSIIYGQPVAVEKEFHTMGTQTDDYGCDNGCSSIYVKTDSSHVTEISETSPQPQPGVSVDGGPAFENKHGPENNVEDRDEHSQSHDPENTMEDSDGEEHGQSHNPENTMKDSDGGDQQQSQAIDEMSALMLGVLKELEVPSGSNLPEHNSEARNDSVDDVERTLEKELHTTKEPIPTKSKRSFKCSHCEKQFSCNSQLITHLRIHSGEKPFQCSYCGKKFAITANLQRHIITHSDKTLKHQTNEHSGEKPTKCPQCDKTFLYKSNLTVHMRLHSGEKPFECSMCKKTFGDRSNYNRHLKRHSGEKPFECAYCGKKCAFKSDLRQHVKSHSQEKRFECLYCEKKFKRNDHLKRHLKTH